MRAALRSEVRKFLTVRSTYIVTALVLAFVLFFSVIVFGYQNAALTPDHPNFLYDAVYTMLGTFVTFSAILAILLVAHEYRYNTINYTLTTSRSRLKVLFAKAIVMLAYATVIGLVVAAIGYFGAKIGVGWAGKTHAPQNLPVADMIWRFTAYTWGYTLVGLIIALLIRGLVGSIVVFFLFPTAEQILSLLLKNNTKYLPFRSLDAIASVGLPEGINYSVLTNTAALAVFTAYFAVAGVAAAVTFARRDAGS